MSDREKAQTTRHEGDDVPVATQDSIFDDPNVSKSPGRYLATRLPTLKPRMLSAPNPIRLIRMLNAHHWAFFFIAFAAWVRDKKIKLGSLATSCLHVIDRHGMPLISSQSL
jgi:SHS family lactate transporter-like MFS transporter